MQLLEEDNLAKPYEEEDFQEYGRTNDLGFFEAGKNVLESHLSTNWLISFGILLLIVVWPIAIFWRSIRFDSARFVEDWIKLSVEGLLLFLLLEIMRERSVSFAAKKSVHRLLAVYGESLRKLIAALTELRLRINQNNNETATALLRTAASAWKTLAHRMSDEFIHRLPDQLRGNLLAGRLELRPDRCESILKSLRASRRPEDYNRAELDELIQRCEKLLAALVGVRNAKKE